VQDYSLYIVGRSGRPVREIEVECANDDAAIDLARQSVDGHDVELWQLDRMIRRFESARKHGDRAGRGHGLDSSTMKPDGSLR
jgi:hypothetical protein